MNPTYGSNSSFLLDEQIVKDVADRRNCTAAQVVLAWGVGRGVSVIPKSKHEKYIRGNLGARECVLEEGDSEAVGRLGERAKRFNNPSKGWGIKLFEGLEDA
jgi:alcohol dehydrogenase (NADP+)